MNEYEQEIILAVAGEGEWPEWGSWVGATLSFLREDGYITSETNPKLTKKGLMQLEDLV